MDAIKTLAARAVLAGAAVENVPSPCVSICRMDAGSGLCEGCFRTLDEIRLWSSSDDTAKKVMWTTLSARLRQTHPDAFAQVSSWHARGPA
jgi:predicted Fe-S protein YdhL (DUF1289 family)